MTKHLLDFIMRDNLNSDTPYFSQTISQNKYLVFNYIV